MSRLLIVTFAVTLLACSAVIAQDQPTYVKRCIAANSEFSQTDSAAAVSNLCWGTIMYNDSARYFLISELYNVSFLSANIRARLDGQSTSYPLYVFIDSEIPEAQGGSHWWDTWITENGETKICIEIAISHGGDESDECKVEIVREQLATVTSVGNIEVIDFFQ